MIVDTSSPSGGRRGAEDVAAGSAPRLDPRREQAHVQGSPYAAPGVDSPIADASFFRMRDERALDGATHGEDITSLLRGERGGAGGSAFLFARVLPAVYKELRALAAAHLRRESAAHTLQPTALVHEAFVRLVGQRALGWENRGHFYAVAARVMRRVLADHARTKRRTKRGAQSSAVSFDEELHGSAGAAPASPLDTRFDDLDDALRELEALDERQARIVELRYYAGMSVDEAGRALGVSPATVKREWAVARAWLFERLRAQEQEQTRKPDTAEGTPR
jgi:RNA polymerase sigma factor (TIGR02999 family)